MISIGTYVPEMRSKLMKVCVIRQLTISCYDKTFSNVFIMVNFTIYTQAMRKYFCQLLFQFSDFECTSTYKTMINFAYVRSMCKQLNRRKNANLCPVVGVFDCQNKSILLILALCSCSVSHKGYII